MTIRKTAVRILYKDNIQDRCLSIRVKNFEDDLSQKDINSCIQTVNDNASINGGKGDVHGDIEILDEGTGKRLVSVVLLSIINQCKPSVLFADISKQCRPRSDATHRGVWSGSPLFN